MLYNTEDRSSLMLFDSISTSPAPCNAPIWLGIQIMSKSSIHEFNGESFVLIVSIHLRVEPPLSVQ